MKIPLVLCDNQSLGGAALPKGSVVGHLECNSESVASQIVSLLAQGVVRLVTDLSEEERRPVPMQKMAKAKA